MTESRYSINNTTFNAGLGQGGRRVGGLQPTIINGFQRPSSFSNQEYTSRTDIYINNKDNNNNILDESTPYELLKEDLPYKKRRLEAKPEPLPPLPPQSQITTRHIAHPKYGLPTSLVDGYRRLGIEEMYEWQAECLCLHPEILMGKRNLCFTAQTSAGKSLVSEILMLKKVLKTGMKGLLVLPYIAIVTEKTSFLKKVLAHVERDGAEIKIVGFHSGMKTKIGWEGWDIGVCTIEKANSLVNTALVEGTIEELGVIVLDELHYVTDPYRGYLLEIAATKLLSTLPPKHLQIIGMTATLENLPVLASWLNASYMTSSFRPVSLSEAVVVDGIVWQKDHQAWVDRGEIEGIDENASLLGDDWVPKRRVTEVVPPTMKMVPSSIKSVVSLVLECVNEDLGVIVFESARKRCEDFCELMSGFMPGPLEGIMDKRMEVIRKLAGCETGLDQFLGKVILKGLAFHHAGLTSEERDIVAEAYDQGAIKVVVATATMAAGINLPARRVILATPRMGINIIDPAMFQQMKGRAGRKGRDICGESFLCCAPNDIKPVRTLLEAKMPKVRSCLITNSEELTIKLDDGRVVGMGLKRAILEMIGTCNSSTQKSLKRFIENTLLYHTHPSPEDLVSKVESSVVSLTEKSLIIPDKFVDANGENKFYSITPLGKAIVASSLSLDEGLFLHFELERTLRSFNLDGELHIIYCFTPIFLTTQVDVKWDIFRDQIGEISGNDEKIMRHIGVEPALVNRIANGGAMPHKTEEDTLRERIHKRFYIALMLRDLMNEVSVLEVSRKWNTARGFVQALASTCQGYAGMLGTFCTEMGWGILTVIFNHYRFRLEFGVKDDLIELAKIPGIKSYLARVFWNKGFKNIGHFAEAQPKDILEVLWEAQPRKLKLDMDEATHMRMLLYRRARSIIHNARRLDELSMDDDL